MEWILLIGTMQEFSNGQILEYYKNNFEIFKKTRWSSILYMKKVKKLLEQIYDDNIIQKVPY